MQALMSLTLNACGPETHKCSLRIDLTIPAVGTTGRHVRIQDATGRVVYEADLAGNVIGFILSDLDEPNTYSGTVVDSGPYGNASGPPGSVSVSCQSPPVDPNTGPTDGYH
jgi:hypothetical protein